MKQKRRKRLSFILLILLLGGSCLEIKHILKVRRIEKEIRKGIQALENLESKDVSDVENKIHNMNKKYKLNNKQEDSRRIKDIFDSIVFMGDSLTEPLSFYNILNDNSVVGIKGRDVIKARKNDLGTVKNLNPEKIVMMYGMNDLLLFKNASEFIKNYKLLVSDVKKELPNTEVYINSIFPVQEKAFKRNCMFGNVEAFNNALKEMCNDMGIKFIDTRNLVNDNMYEPDGIHMKAEFYSPWLRLVQGKIGL